MQVIRQLKYLYILISESCLDQESQGEIIHNMTEYSLIGIEILQFQSVIS